MAVGPPCEALVALAGLAVNLSKRAARIVLYCRLRRETSQDARSSEVSHRRDRRQVKAGAVVVTEGGTTGHLYVLIQGKLEVLRGEMVVATDLAKVQAQFNAWDEEIACPTPSCRAFARSRSVKAAANSVPLPPMMWAVWRSRAASAADAMRDHDINFAGTFGRCACSGV